MHVIFSNISCFLLFVPLIFEVSFNTSVVHHFHIRLYFYKVRQLHYTIITIFTLHYTIFFPQTHHILINTFKPHYTISNTYKPYNTIIIRFDYSYYQDINFFSCSSSLVQLRRQIYWQDNFYYPQLSPSPPTPPKTKRDAQEGEVVSPFSLSVTCAGSLLASLPRLLIASIPCWPGENSNTNTEAAGVWELVCRQTDPPSDRNTRITRFLTQRETGCTRCRGFDRYPSPPHHFLPLLLCSPCPSNLFS